jgi:DNA-binding LacI/PurR family transcriptional regulator
MPVFAETRRVAVGSDSLPPTKADRLAGLILDLIDEQPIEIGKRLPSVRTLALRYGTSVPTVQNAMRLLEGRGIVRCEARRGAFVARRPRSVPPTPPRIRQVGVVQYFAGRDDTQICEQFDSWWARINHGIDVGLRLRGYQTVSLPLFYEMPHAIERFVETVEQWRGHLAGIISLNRPDVLEAIEHVRLPRVTINSWHAYDTEDFVTAANRDAHARFARGLANMNIRRVLLTIGGLTESTSELDRLLGLTQGFAEAGAPLDTLAVEQMGIPALEAHRAAECMSAYLDRGGALPRVIVTGGDDMAYGIIHALNERGIGVPEQVGVVGGTGYRDEQFGVMPLTVIAQPMAEMGIAAADMLVNIIESGCRHLPPRYVPSRIICRASFPMPSDIRQQLEAEYDDDVARYRASAQAFV